MPIDWFLYGAQFLREFGSKPASLVIIIFAAASILSKARLFANKVLYVTLGATTVLLATGILGYLLTEPEPSGLQGRSPDFQLYAQAALLLASGLLTALLMNVLRQRRLDQRILPALELAVTVHLLFFAAEFLWGSSILGSFYSLFRSGGLLIERPSGLMSEPSHFGTFAALFGTPLILGNHKRSCRPILVGYTALICAVVISAKTTFVVLLFQAAYFFAFRMHRKLELKRWLPLLVLGLVCGSALLVKTSALETDVNMSSAMRLGSSHLSLNVIRSEVGFFGIGLGQFHFYYRPEYAPGYLLASSEAATQFAGLADFRASTFNLPLRILVETGIAGFSVFVAFIFYVASKTTEWTGNSNFLASYVFAGSLGFLMTQDTYFYPPWIFAVALLGASAPAKAGRGDAAMNFRGKPDYA